MNVLLLGGCGFIGANIADKLIKNNHNVVIFDLPQCATDRTEHIKDKLCLYNGNIDDTELINNIIHKHNVEVVVHLVSTLLPNSTLQEYRNEISAVIVPTIDIISLCAKLKVKFVFFSSGGTIYGDAESYVHTENDLLAPISYYGLSKCNIENIIRIEKQRNNLNYLILRPSNPYGHGQRLNAKQGLIAVAIGKILKGEPIEIYGDGLNVRDYIYIDDLTEYVCLLLELGIVNETFNIGSGYGYSILQIVNTISRISGKRSNIVLRESRTSDIKSIVLNTEKLRNVTKIEPLPLEDGIKKFYNECLKRKII